jgi:general secretion pathway protein J
MSRQRKRLVKVGAASGFTLVELMISMSIFALLSIMAYGGLDSVIQNKQRTEASMLRLSQLQLSMTKLHRDFEQISTRVATDELGGKLLNLSAVQGNDLLIQLTRNGWRNPAKLNRSHLQRVAYKLEEDQLIRMSWIYVDRAQDDQLIETVLIDNLQDVQLRFMDARQVWHDSWPPISLNTTNTTSRLPQGIEIKLQMNDWGDITRVFRVPPG